MREATVVVMPGSEMGRDCRCVDVLVDAKSKVSDAAPKNLALDALRAHRRGMQSHCEVCESLARSPSPKTTIVSVALETRTVLLCKGHAQIAANSGVTDFEGLRELYGSGRRSYVPRRDPQAKAPMKDDRHNSGRRAGEQA